VHGPSPVTAVARPGKAAAPTPLVWHSLTRLNGWKLASTASPRYGTPAWAYPAAAMASTNLALENGWTSSQSVYDTGNSGYAIKGGVIYLSGSMHSARTARLAFVLPKAARPAR